MRVLYVEDNLADQALTARMLARLAPEIHLESVPSFTLAVQRLDRLAQQPLDVLLCDMRLPDGDGLSLLGLVRQDGLPLAVVILTGMGEAGEAAAALRAGADGYLEKRPGYLASLSVALTAALAHFQS